MTHILGFFYFLNMIKLHHWHTTSHAQHLADDDLVSAVTPKVDRFIECYIRHHGRERLVAVPIPAIQLETPDGAKLLENFAAFIKNTARPACGGMTHMLNILDEIDADIAQCCYRYTLH